MALGHLDNEVINFLIEDNDPILVKQAAESIFKKPNRSENKTAYDYLFEQRSPRLGDADVFGEIPDDVEFDITKVMRRL